ncbi:MAG: hypothetical protein LBC27_04390 [Spirochaetaceae bacterium]|jgi:hypothetical protein|nr:hypothetical protein [Spirochaetaceae bacterium]
MKCKPLLVLCIFFFVHSSVYSWDLTLSGGVDYASYPKDGNDVSDIFKPELQPIYSAEFNGDFGVEHNYSIGLRYDPVWRETFSGGIGYHLGIVDIGLGFFLCDFFSGFTSIDTGFSGHAGFEFPGIFFINAGASVSMGDFEIPARKRFNAEAGFWLPHIFITFDFEIKEFIDNDDKTLDRTTSTRYSGSMEFFSKNVPYRIRFEAGMQNLERSITGSAQSKDVSANHYFAGARFYAEAGKIFAWFAEAEVLFAASKKESSGAAMPYRAGVGIIFSYPEK